VTVINWPMTRLLVSYFGSWYARTITGLPASDATGGFNLFNRRVLETLELDRIHSTGYSFQIELKYRAWRRGFHFVEVPIVFTERGQGESKMSKKIVFEAVWKVWALRIRHLFRRL
jgi:dolichol-phosphate mannosyltransferase